jgi:hypothetical protein
MFSPQKIGAHDYYFKKVYTKWYLLMSTKIFLHLKCISRRPLPVGKFGSMLSKIFIDFFNEIHIDCGITRWDTNMT